MRQTFPALCLSATRFRSPGRSTRLLESTFVPAPAEVVFELLDRQDRFPQWHRRAPGTWRRLKELRCSCWGEYVPAVARVSGKAGDEGTLQIQRRPDREICVRQTVRRRMQWELAFLLTPRPGGCLLTCRLEYRPLGRLGRTLRGRRLRDETTASVRQSLEFIRRLAASVTEERARCAVVREPDHALPGALSEAAPRAS